MVKRKATEAVDMELQERTFETNNVILAYEVYNGVGEDFATRREDADVSLPRMCHWVTRKWHKNHAPSHSDVAAAFNNSRCKLMSRGLKVVCSRWRLSPPLISSPPISPPHLRSPPHLSPPHLSPSHLRSPPHLSPSHRQRLERLEERVTGVEAQLTMMLQQEANMMDILKSLQSDMLSFKIIVEGKRARSPVIITGGMTASLETTERAEEKDLPDGFVREVTWTGSPEVAGWTKVVRMVLLSPVREEECGSKESRPEPVKKLTVLDSDRSVDSNGNQLLNFITPLARMMMPHILMAMGVQTDTATRWNIVRPTQFPKQSRSGECGVYVIAAASFTLAERDVYTLNDAVVAVFRKFCACSLWSRSWMLD
ncbi:hypothetical protein F511_38698 [Dorcoceras hygrometricum]|uniref:Ubiquitin-like protease family profile domain-containing protein n=1 Tax=Dorcoceras hygrometricum TaxID=472368 RepID=A0A2Z7C3L4_9LAMI|nr:hypothetical protein F511_38698 [Dorcoceras hygrometricum]